LRVCQAVVALFFRRSDILFLPGFYSLSILFLARFVFVWSSFDFRLFPLFVPVLAPVACRGGRLAPGRTSAAQFGVRAFMRGDSRY
jgi:hypothetical protein